MRVIISLATYTLSLLIARHHFDVMAIIIAIYSAALMIAGPMEEAARALFKVMVALENNKPE